MAPKVAKKTPKNMKVVPKPIKKTNKKKKNNECFRIYIYKVLKAVNLAPNIGISTKAMKVMNDFVNDQLENIAVEAGRLVAHDRKKTLGAWEIQHALSLSIPGGLSKHAKIEGMKALQIYQRSMASEVAEKSK